MINSVFETSYGRVQKIMQITSALSLLPFMAYSQKQKNVLFIAIDDLRPTLSCLGDPIAITPCFDSFAKKGIVFENAYCQQAVSGPSRASLLTGLYPDLIGVTDLQTHFREQCPDIITLPQYFKNNGYTTVGIGKIFHGSMRTQDAVSWSVPAIYSVSEKKEEYRLPHNRTGRKAAAVEVANLEDNCFIDGKITEEALLRLKQFGNSGEPFFLAVGYIKPHLPFAMPRKYWDLYNNTDFGKELFGKKDLINVPEIALHNSEELRGYTDINDLGEIDEFKIEELLRGYYSCVSFIDTQVGELMKQLQALNLDKNTVVVLWGDNGFHLNEQNLWCKSTNFEAACKVPLLIYDPDILNNNQKIESMVELVDLYPTILNMCGFDTMDYLSGESLLPLMMKGEKGKDKAFSQFPRPYNAIHAAKNQTHMGYTVRTAEWRYTLWYDVVSEDITNKELYYLPGKEYEQENLSDNNQHIDVEKKLFYMVEEHKNRKHNVKK